MFSFSPTNSYQVGDNPLAVVASDLNMDGLVDLVTGSAGQMDAPVGGGPSVSVLLAKSGKTGFQTPRKYEVNATPTSLVVGKFDGDGRPDIVTGGGDVLLSNADGTFRAGPFNLGLGEVVDSGYFNSDLKLDLVTANGVLWGNGDGTFGTSFALGDPFAYGGGYRTPGRLMAIGNFTNDSNLDLIIRGSDSATNSVNVSLLRGNGDGTFGAPRTILSLAPAGSGHWEINSVTTADFNKDNVRDVAVAYSWYGATGWSAGSAYVDTLLGNVDTQLKPTGTFRPGSTAQFSVTFDPGMDRMQLAAADFNGDGKQDLITVGHSTTMSGYEASVLLGKGDGTFTASPYISTTLNSTQFAVADFNGDGYADLTAIRHNIGTSAGYVDLLLNDKQWGTKPRK